MSKFQYLTNMLAAWWRRYMQLGWPIITLIALIGLAGIWLLSDIARDQDNAYRQSTTNFVDKSLVGLGEATTSLTGEYSVWDDAVENITIDVNPDWMKSNFFAQNSTTLAVYRPSRGAHYIYVAPAFEDMRAAIQASIKGLAENPQLRTNPLEPNMGGRLVANNFILIGGHLAAVAVQPLQPEKSSPIRRQFERVEKDVVVFISFIEPAQIDIIASAFGLEDAKLVLQAPALGSEHAPITHTIKDYSGKTLAWVQWKHQRPGSTAFSKRIVPIVLGLILVGLLTVLITLKIVTANLNLLAKARAAEEANRTKSNFLANVSHELRTPLNTIIGYSEMIEEESVDLGIVQTAKDAKKVTNSAQHLLALINDLLDHSKIEAGKMDLNPTQTDLEPILSSVCEAIQSHIKKNTNQLVMKIDPAIGSVMIDAMRLKQCLLNLLSNAAKFTHNGTITLSAMRLPADNGDVVEITVTDTGLGMNAAAQKKLFSPFVQADEKIASQFGGTGLGLVITKALVEAMGGTISVKSKEGVGSTFTLKLPKGREDVQFAPVSDNQTVALAA